MSTNAYYLNQYISTTLVSVGGITDSATTGIILNSLTNIDYTKPGIACLSYTSPIDTSKAEWITYTSINDSTKELQGVTRGQEGYSAKPHDNGVTVAFPISESHINNLNTALIIGGSVTNLLEGILDEDDMASDSATKGATQQSIKAYVDNNIPIVPSDGWTPANETWAYASATTITVPSGAASKYSIGDKIKLTQTTVKYFYIVGVSDTVLTITGGDSYTLINAAISDNYYSHISTPIGFPQWFNYATSLTVTAAGGTAPTYANRAARFTLNGRTCRYHFSLTNSTGGTAGVGSVVLSISNPIVGSNPIVVTNGIVMWYNGTAQAFLASQSGTTATIFKKYDTSNLNAVDQNNEIRQLVGEITYEI